MTVSSRQSKFSVLCVILALVLSIGCKPETPPNRAPQTGALISPIPTPLPVATSTPTLVSPLPTPVPTPWPPDFTPSPEPMPSPTPEGVPYIITDPVNHFSMTVLPGWRAYVSGITSIMNYDDENLSDVHTFPPGGLKIQIGVGKLPAGQSFEQWLSNWIALSTTPPPGSGLPSLTTTKPLSYTLGRYEGVTYLINDTPRIMEIVLPLAEGRIMIIGLTPADSPALSDGLSMLSTLNVLSELSP